MADVLTDAFDAVHDRIKPLHDAIVASASRLCDAYLLEVSKLLRVADQHRHVNAPICDRGQRHDQA